MNQTGQLDAAAAHEKLDADLQRAGYDADHQIDDQVDWIIPFLKEHKERTQNSHTQKGQRDDVEQAAGTRLVLVLKGRRGEKPHDPC